ncbi:hypothetical protein FHS76_003518 [Ochrobactrum daejeonense]|uniref:Uncharacterized protein n=1 Tax=Brucella daejeonensis TaxID=659015 RepID=A0A7W9B069_9HYPH|nr:hypothetical protein [Brucella daejeonensis]MBB5703611.1 hypothetical protein [Brucella daejeonensis]NKB79855.1 hypothetical protein [Brucella daejeonensis]
MIDYGKFTAIGRTETDQETGVSYDILVFLNSKGVDWLDVSKGNPSNFYCALTDNGEVIFATDEADQIQIDGYRLIGVETLNGYTFGDTGTIYGKQWDGTKIGEPVAPPPDEISDRQFFQKLAVMGIIGQADALAAVQRGEIPAPLQAIIDQLPTEDAKFEAQMLVAGAQTFNRTHPLTEIVRQTLGWTVEQRDDFWREAANL